MTPDPSQIIDLMEAFRRSKTLFAALKLGVFDALETTAAASSDLSPRLGTNPDALDRLLDACAGLGLLERTAEGFRNTPLATRYLTGKSDHSLAGYIRYSDAALYPMWAHLEDAVREGAPRWQQTFGWSGPMWDHFFHTEEQMRTYLRGMHGLGMWASPAVVRAFDLSRFEVMADLGAATGHLVIAACETWPNLRGIAFDLPRTLAIAQEYIAKSAVRDRVEIRAGDFFEDPLPQADLYALGRILHDWKELQIDLLLGKIHEALPPGGGLLIAERLLDEDRLGPLGAHMQSLNMLISTEGKERTLSEYAELLARAGFADVRGQRTGRYLDAILARKR